MMMGKCALFLVAGLLVLTPVHANAGPPFSREAQIMLTAKTEIARRESWPQGAQFSVEPNPQGGWRVTACRIRSSKNGRTKLANERRTINFDADGKLTDYRPGK
jgi:hypothetical protein